MHKEYVEVFVHFDKIGNMQPLSVKWHDGRIFEIDKILDVRRAASIRVGGQGLRYTIRLWGKDTFLFYDKPRWFVEAIDENRELPPSSW